MKTRWRITAPGRRRELYDLVLRKLEDADRKFYRAIHTYPYRSVAEHIVVAVVIKEKGEPLLLNPEPGRTKCLEKVVAHIHEEFDRTHRWIEHYDYDRTAAFIVAAVTRAEARSLR